MENRVEEEWPSGPLEITITPNAPPEGETNVPQGSSGDSGVDGASVLRDALEQRDGASVLQEALTQDQPVEQIEQENLVVEPQEEQSQGAVGSFVSDVAGGVREAPRAIGRGLYKGLIDNPSQLVLGNIPTLTLMDGEGNILDPLSRESYNSRDYKWTLAVRDREQNMLQVPDRLMPRAPETVTGGMVEGITQFAAGFGLAGKALQAVGYGAQGLQGGSRIAQIYGQSIIAEQVSFDPHEERLSNFIQETPLANPFNEWMAADPEDTEAEARFKMAAEAVLIGGALDSMLGIGRLMRARRRLKDASTPEAVEAAQRELMEEADNLHRIAEAEGSLDDVAPSGWGEPTQGELDLVGGSDSRSQIREATEADPVPQAPSARTPINKIVDVGDQELADIISFSIREDGFGQGRNLTGLNLSLIQNSDDIQSMMNALSALYRQEWDRAHMGPMGERRSWEVVRQNRQDLAEILGQDPNLIMQSMQRHGIEMRHADAQMKLYMDMLTTVGKKTHNLATLVNDPRGALGPYASRQDLEIDFARHLELLGHLQENMRGLKTSYGRAFNAFKMGGEGSLDLQGVNLDELWGTDNEVVRKIARRVAMTDGGVKEMTRQAKGGFISKLEAGVVEYWINSILSGLTTHQVNMWSSIMATAFHPTEKIVAGAVRATYDGPEGRRQMAEGAWQYAFMLSEFKDALTLAGKAFRHGKNIADPLGQKYEIRQAIAAHNYGVTNHTAAMAIDGLGTTVRLPSRLLMTEDEFIKQWTARSAAKGRAMSEARQMGLKGDDVSAHIARRMEEMFDPQTGRIMDQSILEEARANTFTGDTRLAAEDTWGGQTQAFSTTVQDGLQKHPIWRLTIPFVRTPTNLGRFVADRSPPLITAIRKENVNIMKGKHGREARDQLIAKQITGGMLWASAIAMAHEGKITGAGPSDPRLRRQLELGGWKPFAYRTVDENGNPKFVPISRLGPFADFFTLAAGFTEAAGYLTDVELSEAAEVMMVTTIQLLKDKAFLQGAVNLVTALDNPEQSLSNYTGGMVAGLVPNILNQNVKNDELLRETHTWIDHLRRRTPGLSEGLDPNRTVLGELQHRPPGYGPSMISPFVSYTAENARGIPRTEEFLNQIQPDPRHELARLGEISGRVIGPVNPVFGELDWREHRSSVSGYTFYDRIRELSGELQINGRTLVEDLERIIQSRAYVNQATDGDQTGHSTRMNILSDRIAAYRAMALQKALEEEPEIFELYRKEMERQARLQRQQHGGPAAPLLPQQ